MDRRLNTLETKWSRNLAYVVGLIAADGNLSPDGRHINITSKDKEITSYVKEILGLSNVIGRKARGGSAEKKYYVLQFGSKNFYAFLSEIGLMPAKSKTLKTLQIPDSVFPDFLRGCIDGDGNIHGFKHPESKHIQLRLTLASASPPFLFWIHETIGRILKTKGGWVTKPDKKSTSLLRFGKADSIQILRAMYASHQGFALRRKLFIARKYTGE